MQSQTDACRYLTKWCYRCMKAFLENISISSGFICNVDRIVLHLKRTWSLYYVTWQKLSILYVWLFILYPVSLFAPGISPLLFILGSREERYYHDLVRSYDYNSSLTFPAMALLFVPSVFLWWVHWLRSSPYSHSMQYVNVMFFLCPTNIDCQ